MDAKNDIPRKNLSYIISLPAKSIFGHEKLSRVLSCRMPLVLAAFAEAAGSNSNHIFIAENRRLSVSRVK